MASDVTYAAVADLERDLRDPADRVEEREDSDLTVVKIGGSVLTDVAAYRRTAEFLAARVRRREGGRIVAVVSAEQGATDALLSHATEIAADPDPATMDLLWSTGELRSVALLTVSLQALHVRATPANVHQTGLIASDRSGVAERSLLPLRLRALLASHEVVVAPGFLARGLADRVVSLGRGGSDLTAVLLAAGLGAHACELVKDVPGYFSADPNHDRSARHLPSIDYAAALTMADDGCTLVQRQALEVAQLHRLTIVVRSLASEQRTVVRGGVAAKARS